MSSALRLGLSRPAATGALHLLRPLPASCTARSATPIRAPTRSFSSTPAALSSTLPVLYNTLVDLPSTPADLSPTSVAPYSTPAALEEPISQGKSSKHAGHVAWEPTKPKIKKTGLPRQGIPLDQEDVGHKDNLIPNPYARDPHIPDYPYGPRRIYKQSNYGLYGNARIRFGNNVSEKHNVKTPRVWRPNVQRKRLWSFALGCWVQTRITMRVLRTIDKVGGLDNYLLGDKPARVKELGPWGWKLRWRIMRSDVVKNLFHKQRIALGLIAKTQADYDDDLASEMRSVSHAMGHELLGTSTGSDLIAETIAETDRWIASGADISFGIEGPLGNGDPLAIEGMNFEPEADQDGADSSFGNKDVDLGAEVAKDEGFMKEVKP